MVEKTRKQWYKELDRRLEEFELEHVNAGNCVHVERTKRSIIIVVCIDDLIVVTNRKKEFT